MDRSRPQGCILFLADRNILADQAFNAFSAFDEDARVRIEPDAIRKKAMVPDIAISSELSWILYWLSTFDKGWESCSLKSCQDFSN